jgi:hypothetical protein
MKLILLIAALYAALVAVNHLNPGPGDADVRGDARIVGDDQSPDAGATE